MIRWFDITVSLIAIFFTVPLFMVSLCLSMCFIGFPPFYVSKRRGYMGRDFNHVKIRTMLPGPQIGRVFFELNRINRVGWFLRISHLDELPDLFHILVGQMSFVGPRPLMLQALEAHKTKIRENVKPGWTGLAQVQLLKKGVLSKELQERLDIIYVEKRSFVYNLRIIFATFRYAVLGKKIDINPNTTNARIQFQKNGFKYHKK
ncbi:sugar transferase [bacterium]|nr:sugar transferase [bacterium]